MPLLALLLTLFLTTTPVQATAQVQESLTTKTGTVMVAHDQTYDPTTAPTISITTTATLPQHFTRLLRRLQGQDPAPVLTVKTPDNQPLETRPLTLGSTTLSLDPATLKPGEYDLTLDDTPLSHFSWGVLVLNTDKARYTPNAPVYLQAASLNPHGHTLCNSQLQLSYAGQSHLLTPNPTCGKNNVTDQPDYSLTLPAPAVGTHTLTLTDLSTNHQVTTTITVLSELPYTVKRQGATRINPFKSDYTLTLTLTAHTPLKGTLSETIPTNFTALTPTTWDLDLNPGETTTLHYTYHAPPLSPAIFSLGPLTLNGESLPGAWSLASDATFEMQTGYYVGDGVDDRAITGVGFQPDLVLIKEDNGSGDDGVILKTSAMSGETSSRLGEVEADLATNAIQSLDSDGFTLGTESDVNIVGTNKFNWVAFGGSDCSSSGTFCVGTYTGDGLSSKSITSVGFQPDFVAIKSSGSHAGVWTTSDVPVNTTQHFGSINELTDGTGFKTLDATGFTIGNHGRVNTNSVTYWFFAFKDTTGAFETGTFTGNGTDNRSITTSFDPELVFIKNSNATVAEETALNSIENSGNYTSSFEDLGNLTGWIKSLGTNSFTVGTAAGANENTKTIYWVSFAGISTLTPSGIFKMYNGTYTGNGTSQSISGLGFSPDLVIVKDESGATHSVFRTRLMKGDETAYFGNASGNFSGAITSLDSDGFSLGSNATVNTSSTTYHYQAFSNAFNPETKTGSANFAIGAYTGNGLDDRDILRQPFAYDLIGLKNIGGSTGAWRTSAQSGDLSVGFSGISEAANMIQSLGTSSFQVGTDSRSNQANTVVHFFAFKTGLNFYVGNYTGNGTGQNVTAPNFEPDLVWIRSTGGVNGVFRPSTLAGDSTHYFVNTAAAADRITALISTGFTIGGNRTETNTNSTTYRYAAWRINNAPSTPSLDSPSDSATNQSLTPTLQTTATDSDSDYLRYKLELCENVGMSTNCQTFDQTSSQTGWSGQNTETSTAYTSGTQASYTLQTALTPSTTYYYRSYAIDPVGTNTWSATQGTPYSFTTTTTPSAPTTPYAEGATNPTNVTDLTPEFSAVHSDSDSDPATAYEIEVNTNNTFTGTVLWDTGSTAMTSLPSGNRSTDVSYSGSALSLGGTTYYWRIRFTDNKGAVGAWSTTQSFATNSSSNTPTLDAPTNGATNQSLTPTLQTTATDPNSDYLRYKFELCENLGMTTNCQTFDQTSSQTGWSGQNTETSTAYTSGTQASYTLQTALTPSTTYYYRSYAIDPVGTNTWSATQGTPYSFTTLSGAGTEDLYLNGINLNGIILN